MAVEIFGMLIHELSNKDQDIFPEAAPLILLDRKSTVCMNKNGKDTKHTTIICGELYPPNVYHLEGGGYGHPPVLLKRLRGVHY